MFRRKYTESSDKLVTDFKSGAATLGVLVF
jgi:hypothetical protein